MTPAARDANLYIGTSGWSYPSWRGPFFPRDLPTTRHLAFYAGRFPTTELNGVFYRTPSVNAVRIWVEQTPECFLFAWKASQFITHWKLLKDSCRNSLELMESRLELLGNKAGPVLFQLPHRFDKDCPRLVSFLGLLSTKHRYAFEFRHPSWYSEDVLTALSEHDIALCISDHHQAPAPWVATARHIYVRAHGPGGCYKCRYVSETLDAWAGKLAGMLKSGHTGYVYFDNDEKCAAPMDAAIFLQTCAKKPELRVARPNAIKAESRRELSR